MKHKTLIITIVLVYIGITISLFCYAIKLNDEKEIREVTNEFNELAKIPNNKDFKTILKANDQIKNLKKEKNKNIYEKELKDTLNYYYENDKKEEIALINKTIDKRGKEIVNNYKEASIERNNKNTNYQTDTVLLTIPIDEDASKVTEEYDGKVLNVMSVSNDEKLVVVDISNEYTTDKAIDNYESINNDITGQLNYKYTFDPDNDKAMLQAATRDSYSSYQWYLNKNTGINAYEAWNMIDSMTHQKVKVGVIDSGVNKDHDDLQTCLKWASNNNKLVTIDSVDGSISSGITDENGHGTHVTGLIGATSNNNVGIAGVASGNKNDIVDLVVVDAYNETKAGFFTVDMVAGIDYLKNIGVKVINMSLGRYGSTEDSYTYEDYILYDAVSNAYKNGITVVASGGNGAKSNFIAPADFGEAISVVSINGDNKRSSFSDYNSHKDIAAPGGSYGGDGLVSTFGANYCDSNDNCGKYNYIFMQGTSQAAPVVSGVIAMAYSVYPKLTPLEVRNIITLNADDLGEKGKDDYYGYGKINPINILNSLKTKIINNSSSNSNVNYSNTIPTVKNLSVSLKSYNSVNLRWNSVSNVDGYMIYYRRAGSNDWLSFTSSSNSATKNNLTKGYKYYFKVKAFRYGNFSNSFSNQVSVVTLKKPTIKLTKVGSKKVRITYNDIPGEDGYRVYRKQAGKKWQLIKTRSEKSIHSYKDTAKKGKKYYYKVRAYKWVNNKRVFSEYSTTKSIRR